MRLVVTLLFAFSLPLEILAGIGINYTFTRQLGDLYKVAVISKTPEYPPSPTVIPHFRHYFSIWKDVNGSTTGEQERMVTFYFDVNRVNRTTVLEMRVGYPSTTNYYPSKPTPYPRNYDSLNEFLYYFTFYNGGCYFSLPTEGAPGIQTIIFPAGLWWTGEPQWMRIICTNCTEGVDHVYFSMLDWGKLDADLWKLEEKASKMSPYYGKTKAIIDKETIEALDNNIAEQATTTQAKKWKREVDEKIDL